MVETHVFFCFCLSYINMHTNKYTHTENVCNFHWCLVLRTDSFCHWEMYSHLLQCVWVFNKNNVQHATDVLLFVCLHSSPKICSTLVTLFFFVIEFDRNVREKFRNFYLKVHEKQHFIGMWPKIIVTVNFTTFYTRMVHIDRFMSHS